MEREARESISFESAFAESSGLSHSRVWSCSVHSQGDLMNVGLLVKLLTSHFGRVSKNSSFLLLGEHPKQSEAEIADVLISISFQWLSLLSVVRGLRCFGKSEIFFLLFLDSSSSPGCKVSFNLCLLSCSVVFKPLSKAAAKSPSHGVLQKHISLCVPRVSVLEARQELKELPLLAATHCFHMSRQLSALGIIPALLRREVNSKHPGPGVMEHLAWWHQP